MINQTSYRNYGIDTCFFVSTSISLIAVMKALDIFYLPYPFPEKPKKHYDIHYIGFVYELILVIS